MRKCSFLCFPSLIFNSTLYKEGSHFQSSIILTELSGLKRLPGGNTDLFLLRELCVKKDLWLNLSAKGASQHLLKYAGLLYEIKALVVTRHYRHKHQTSGTLIHPQKFCAGISCCVCYVKPLAVIINGTEEGNKSCINKSCLQVCPLKASVVGYSFEYSVSDMSSLDNQTGSHVDEGILIMPCYMTDTATTPMPRHPASETAHYWVINHTLTSGFE